MDNRTLETPTQDPPTTQATSAQTELTQRHTTHKGPQTQTTTYPPNTTSERNFCHWTDAELRTLQKQINLGTHTSQLPIFLPGRKLSSCRTKLYSLGREGKLIQKQRGLTIIGRPPSKRATPSHPSSTTTRKRSNHQAQLLPTQLQLLSRDTSTTQDFAAQPTPDTQDPTTQRLQPQLTRHPPKAAHTIHCSSRKRPRYPPLNDYTYHLYLLESTLQAPKRPRQGPPLMTAPNLPGDTAHQPPHPTPRTTQDTTPDDTHHHPTTAQQRTPQAAAPTEALAAQQRQPSTPRPLSQAPPTAHQRERGTYRKRVVKLKYSSQEKFI